MRRISLHLVRLGVFALVVWLMRAEHAARERHSSSRGAAPVAIDRLRAFFADAHAIGQSESHGPVPVLNKANETIGYFAQTSPMADTIVGYAGPTNTLVAFDRSLRVVGIDIVRSDDTAEHVRDVVRDRRFMTALVGRDWKEAADTVSVDAVSGATLTSLAMLEGISLRLGGERPSLRFPEEITLAEVQTVFPTAASLNRRESYPSLRDVADGKGGILGAVFRTSPASDDQIGYQGPTDLLVALDANDNLLEVRIRKSYDNEPYVGYVREDGYFFDSFRGQSLASLSKLDPRAAGVEGVSGATMTSIAVAHGLSRGAAAATVMQPARRIVIWSKRDVGTCGILITALLLTFTRLRHVRWVRWTFPGVLVVYFGFLNGDMLSQALLVGWARSGVPWQLAPGLVILASASLLIPAVSKRQLYCNHVCPFGAAQRMVRRRLPWRISVPRRMTRVLGAIPSLLLLFVVVSAMRCWRFNLASIEPFDAFFVRVAGPGTLAVAIVGLIASLFVPMAYCRFGCPSGAVFKYVRYGAGSHRWGWHDGVAFSLLMVAVILRLVTRAWGIPD